MKHIPYLLTALLATCLPAMAVNPPSGGTCADGGGGCDEDGESENKQSWSWSLDIGEVEFTSTNNLLGYARTGPNEGSLRGGAVRTFGDIFSDFNGGTSTKQNLLIYFDKKNISADIAKPAVLKIDAAMTAAKVIRTAGVIRQVLTDSVFTDVSLLENGSGYTVKTWSLKATGTPVLNAGLYTLPAAEPYYAITFSNPDHPMDKRCIDKTFVERTGNFERTITARYAETFLAGSGGNIPDTLTVTTYAGATATGAPLRREAIKYSNRGTGTLSGSAAATGTRRYWDYNLERTISEATLSPSGALGPLEIVSKTFEQFADFTVYTGTTEPDTGGAEGARRMISMTVGHGNLDARTTAYTYVSDPGNPYIHGSVRSRTNPDGSWEFFNYTDAANSSLRTETRWSSWKNVSLANREQAKKTIITIEPNQSTSVTSIAGQIVAQEETLLQTQADGSLRTTARQKSGTEWQETITLRFPQVANTLTSGRIRWMENPDGTATTYAYASTPDGYTITESSGAGDRTGITAGTRTIGTYNVENTLVGNSSFDIESGLQLDAWMKSDLDNKGRPQRTDYPLDGTYSISQYSCCGIGFSRDRSGATQSFSRDPLKRVYLVASRRSSAGPQLFTATNYDGLTTKTTLNDGTLTLLLSETTTNLAGETILMKSPDANADSLAESTTMLTSYPAGGGKTITTTNPDGSTEIRTSFADGQPASSSGTAVVQMTYDPATFIQSQDVAQTLLRTLSLPRTAEIIDVTLRPMKKSPLS